MGHGTFEVKRGHAKNIEGGKLGGVLKAAFGNVKDLGGGKFEATLGPLTVQTWIEGKSIVFESNNPTTIDDKTATEVVRARNQFLQNATGLSAKERVKRAKKAVAGAEQ
jgi:hypothetical protein